MRVIRELFSFAFKYKGYPRHNNIFLKIGSLLEFYGAVAPRAHWGLHKVWGGLLRRAEGPLGPDVCRDNAARVFEDRVVQIPEADRPSLRVVDVLQVLYPHQLPHFGVGLPTDVHAVGGQDIYQARLQPVQIPCVKK